MIVVTHINHMITTIAEMGGRLDPKKFVVGVNRKDYEELTESPSGVEVIEVSCSVFGNHYSVTQVDSLCDDEVAIIFAIPKGS